MADKYSLAIDYATQKHSGQFRKGFGHEPYINHPINVAKILKQTNCKDEVVIAGVLHDVVEDTQTPIEEIKQKFGKKVSDLVASVTNKCKGVTWDEKQQRYLKKLEGASKDTKMICAADKIDNMKSTIESLEQGFDIFGRLKAGKDKQIEKFKNIFEKISTDITPQMKKLYLDTLKHLIRVCK